MLHKNILYYGFRKVQYIGSTYALELLPREKKLFVSDFSLFIKTFAYLNDIFRAYDGCFMLFITKILCYGNGT